MVICLVLDADLHMAQLLPLPLTVSCFSKIQIGFAFLVPADPGSPGKRAVKRVCVCVFCGRKICGKVTVVHVLQNSHKDKDTTTQIALHYSGSLNKQYCIMWNR